MDRRDFLRTAGGGAVLATTDAVRPPGRRQDPGAAAEPRTRENQAVPSQRPQSGRADREFWVGILRRLADPVLTHLANGTLKARMPVEQAPGADRRSVTHLEALGRLIAGIAPWLEPAANGSARSAPETPTVGGTIEERLRTEYVALAQRAVARAVDPFSPDALNFSRDRQPLVDAAFLAQGILRAPGTLRDGLDAATKRHLVAALESTRTIVPAFNNWLLFSAMVEAGLKSLGAGWDRVRVDYALRQHEQWYLGDGTYGDGPAFHWDYYNSFVIHPMLVDILDACGDEMPPWKEQAVRETERARRYAVIQERLIAPDGTFPPIGRSITYRCGAFHLLAQVAFRRVLPDSLSPAQVRSALTAVIRRSLDAPETFDSDGWLRIGFCGHQPGIGEPYISTGSLYLCAVALLPLGLPPSDDFWSAPGQPWTSVKAWSGQPFPIDRAI
jgi:hypothetical protein